MVTPEEAARDNPEVNGHTLEPQDSDGPTDHDRVWVCEDCGKRATDMEHFETIECEG